MSGVFAERARWIAGQLPQWGQQLYAAALKADSAQEPLRAWQAAANAARQEYPEKLRARLCWSRPCPLIILRPRRRPTITCSHEIGLCL